jgi:hypothetical protein
MTPYNSLLALVSGLSDVKLSEDDIGDGDNQVSNVLRIQSLISVL